MSQIRVCTTIKVTGLIIPDRTLRAPRTTGGATNPVLITLFSTSPDLETEFPTKLISTRGSDTTRQKPSRHRNSKNVVQASSSCPAWKRAGCIVPEKIKFGNRREIKTWKSCIFFLPEKA